MSSFSKIPGFIRKSMCSTDINDTGGRIAAGINDASGKLPSASTKPAANLPPVSFTPVANNWNNYQTANNLKWTLKKHLSMPTPLPKGSGVGIDKWWYIIVVNNKKNYWRFFPFATGVNYTGGKPWAANISANFRKIRNGFNGILRLGGNWFMKNPEAKTCDTVPLI